MSFKNLLKVCSEVSHRLTIFGMSIFPNYQPRRSWAKVGCLPQCMLGYPATPLDQAHTPPDQADTPPEQTPPWTRQTPPRPGRHPPRSRHSPPDQTDTPPRADPSGSRPPQEQTPPLPLDQADPPREADCSMRLTSGRYASYWNAFLLYIFLDLCDKTTRG